ncbi:MAG: LptF/LptG family permease, partial [Gemmatimonadales bacterium]
RIFHPVKILHKYVLKEHLGPLVFALTALTSLLLLQYIAKRFGELVGKGLPWSVIAEFLVLSLPLTIALSLPMAVLVATLYAFSRLASENEITALKASGVSIRKILTPVLWAAAGVTLFMVAFNDQVLPRANHKLRTLQGDIAQKKPTFALREQVINEVSPGKLYLRAGRLSQKSNVMRDITIYDLEDMLRRRTIYSDSGNMAMSANHADLMLTLYSGTVQDVPTSNPEQLQRLYFKTQLIRVSGVGNEFEKTVNDTYKGEREMSVCEMERNAVIARRRFIHARDQLRKTIAMARQRKVKLSKEVLSTRMTEPLDIGLGRAYCSLLERTGVKELAAQTPVQQDPVKARTDSIRARVEADAARAEQARADSARAAAVQDTTDSVRAGAGSQGRTSIGTSAPAAPALRTTLPPSAGMMPAPVRAPGSPSPGPAPSQGASGAPLANAQGDTASTYSGPVEMIPGQVEAARLQVVEALRSMNRYDVEIQKKFALAAACFIFVLLGAPIALRFPRAGVGLTIGVSLVVFGLYYVGLIAGESLAKRGYVPPVVSMWIANVVFGIIALILLSRMGKEAGSSRGGDWREILDNLRYRLRRRAPASIAPRRVPGASGS